MKYVVLGNETLKFNLTLCMLALKTLRFCTVQSPLVTVLNLGIIFGINPNIFI